MSCLDEEIGVGRWNVDDGRFYLVESTMGGEECNQRRMTEKTEEFVSCFFICDGRVGSITFYTQKIM